MRKHNVLWPMILVSLLLTARPGYCETQEAVEKSDEECALSEAEATAVFDLVDTQKARLAELEFAVALQDTGCRAFYWEGFRDGEREVRKDAWFKVLGLTGLFVVGVLAGASISN